MILFRRIAGRGAMLVAGLAAVSGAQAKSNGSDVGGAHRWGLGLSADAGTLPRAFVPECQRQHTPGAAGVGVTAFLRPRTVVVFEADVRGSATMPCRDAVMIPPPAPTLPPGVSKVSTLYSDTPRTPLLRSSVRVGVEAPRPLPLIRATFGGGMIVSGARMWFGAAALGIATRSEGARMFAELERNVVRARVEALYATVTKTDTTYSSVIRVVPEVEYPSWTTVHLGVELPLGVRR